MNHALLPLSDALATVLAAIEALPSEVVPLSRLAGRVLAETVCADADVPAFDRAAMDGIAVRTTGAAPGAIIHELGASPAGSPFAGAIAPGTCVRVMTGGVVPAGADAVVPIERVEVLTDDAGARRYRLLDPLRAEQHVTRRGAEVLAGQEILTPGTLLQPVHLGLLASYGRDSVRVRQRPVVALVPTGDEIVPVSQAPRLGQVRDANRHVLTALLEGAGAEVRQFAIAADEPAALRRALAAAWQDVDVLITSGGVSAGDHDLVPPTLFELGAELHFHKIAIKPGKPLLFATRVHGGRRQYAFGLPGNPLSSLVCCALLALPALRALQAAPADWQTFTLPSARRLPPTGPRTEILPARLTILDNFAHADVQTLSSSADLTRFADAAWFAVRSPHAPELRVGEAVALLAWPRPRS